MFKIFINCPATSRSEKFKKGAAEQIVRRIIRRTPTQTNSDAAESTEWNFDN